MCDECSVERISRSSWSAEDRLRDTRPSKFLRYVPVPTFVLQEEIIFADLKYDTQMCHNCMLKATISQLL